MSNASSRSAGSSQERHDRGSAPSREIPIDAITAFAHDLRNALGPVRTATYLLRASTSSDAQAVWALDLIDRQAQAIATAVDELTDLVRIARGTLELIAEPVDLGDTLDAVVSPSAPGLAEKRQSLAWKRPAAPVTVSGDRARLVQTFAALVRATSNMGIAGSVIAVALDRNDRDASITIGEQSDAPANAALGTHAPVDQGNDVTEARPRWGQLSGSVGLVLAQAILRRHGGAVTARHPSGFEIRLPLAD